MNRQNQFHEFFVFYDIGEKKCVRIVVDFAKTIKTANFEGL